MGYGSKEFNVPSPTATGTTRNPFASHAAVIARTCASPPV
jgi:hypothetical protein